MSGGRPFAAPSLQHAPLALERNLVFFQCTVHMCFLSIPRTLFMCATLEIYFLDWNHFVEWDSAVRTEARC